MNSATYFLIFATALLSVGGESLLESIPVVGDSLNEVADAIAEEAYNATANVTSVVTDGFKSIRLTLIANGRNATFDLDNATGILSDSSFNSALPTVVYMHGYSETRDSESVAVVSAAFNRKGTHNFIFVDWSRYARSPYVSAFTFLPGVGVVVGDTVDRLVQAGLSRDGLWLIGHSMGGQMTGMVSRALDFKPKRITALDPAAPGYSIPRVPNNLTRDDAYLVDVIHTDAGKFGFSDPCGHIDFWPNSGRAVQPGCNLLSLNAFCSHHRSWWFFSESLANETAFPAVRCTSWDDFEAAKCPVNATNIAYLGYNVPIDVQAGDYYLKTNDASPFAQGLQGVTVEVQTSFFDRILSIF